MALVFVNFVRTFFVLLKRKVFHLKNLVMSIMYHPTAAINVLIKVTVAPEINSDHQHLQR